MEQVVRKAEGTTPSTLPDAHSLKHIYIVRRAGVMYSSKKGVIVFVFVLIVFILPALVILYTFFPAGKVHVFFGDPEGKQVISFHQIGSAQVPCFQQALLHHNFGMLNAAGYNIGKHTVFVQCTGRR